MQKNDLDRAKKLIKRLSTEDRKNILDFLTEFPDSGFQSYDLREELEVLKKHGKRHASPADDPDHYLVNLVFVRNLVSVQIHDTDVLVTMFFPDKFIEAYPMLKGAISILSEKLKKTFTEEKKNRPLAKVTLTECKSQ
jgi:hypothetical protein